MPMTQIERNDILTPSDTDTYVLPDYLGTEGDKGEDDFHLFLPFSDLSVWIGDRELISVGAQKFRLWGRLEGVNSLSHLSYAMTSFGPDTRVAYASLNQDRLNHSLVVAKVMEEILRRNDFPENEVLEGTAGAELHDRATPALGDVTKNLDEDNLHEEHFWWEGLDEDAWKLLEDIGAQPEAIDDIIHNREILGEILDIADKIGYTMIDLHQLGRSPGIPDLGNIYKQVRYNRETGEVYFTDPDYLRTFLMARAQNFYYVYLSPKNQAAEHLMTLLIQPFYSLTPADGKLTPQQLRQMTDTQLMDFLATQHGVPPYQFGKGHFWFPEYTETRTEQEAQEKAREIANDPKYKLIGIKKGNGFNPATHFKVLDDEAGQVMPFSQYSPAVSKALEEMAEEKRGYYVVYVNRDNQDIARYLPD
jgi:hypothetical protein